MKYRSEIDGLRAVAVLPVIFFHAGFEIFSGGFVGVDVFFVISGYLITAILIEDIERGEFSILRFYERRARRILPALFFVMLCCLPFAWMWMLPTQMKAFSQSLVAVSLFASNILFWRESGYFESAAEDKPLLHTWSLAVEEQYYILFPIFLFLAWRFGKKRVFWSIVILAAISLAASEWGWRNKPTANFYLAPTRAWELLAGSIAAFIVQKEGVQKNEALSLLGLGAILFSIFAYDESIPFPSVYTLVPVLGVVLIILFAKRGTVAARVLSAKAFVAVGLISYSAYLWHQPLFAFARIRSLYEPSQYLMAALAVLSLVLAAFSWKYVEQPFRIGKATVITTRSSVFAVSIVGVIGFTAMGLWGSEKNGFSIASETIHQTEWVMENIDSNFIILGDSHADHLEQGLRSVTSGYIKNLSRSGCIPFRNVDRYDTRSRPGECVDFVNSSLNWIVQADETAVLLISAMGPVYLDGTAFKGKDMARVTGLGVELVTDPSMNNNWDVFEAGMRNTLEELLSLQNLSIVFSIDVPELGIDFGCETDHKRIVTPFFTLNDMVSDTNSDQCFVLRSEYEERSIRYRELVYSIVSDYPSIHIFDPTDYFCDDEVCFGYLDKYGYLYKDFDHLSQAGSIYYAHSLVSGKLNLLFE